MNRLRFLSTLALVLALGLSACGMPGGTQSGQQDQQQQAKEQFLNERATASAAGGGNTGAATSTAGGGNTGGASQNTTLLGMVERIDGQTIVVKNMEDNDKTVTVQLAGDTKIQQDAQIKPTDIKAGDTIVAIGAKDGEVIQAGIVQIGNGDLMGGAGIATEAGPSGGAGPGGAPPMAGGPGGAPPQGGMPAGGPPQQVSGTVERVEGDTIMVKQSDGSSVTIKSTSSTQIRKQVEAKLADIQSGAMIMVAGVQNGEAFQATQVRVLPAPSLMKP